MGMYNRLAILLQEAHQALLQEAQLTAPQMKAKIGIKKDAISDEDFQELMNITQDKKQLAALAGYVKETGNLDTVLLYAQKMVDTDPRMDPQKYKTFIAFSEFIDAKDATQGYRKKQDSFDIEKTPADWQSEDGRYKVYDCKDMGDCIKYGKGQTFCISRLNGGNMYGHYRANQESKYYFVFDLKMHPVDNDYITVVDAHPNGKFEFTHKNNDTATTSKYYQNNLDNFLKKKPGLQGAKELFKPNPLSPEERKEMALFRKVNDEGGFPQLSKQQKIKFIHAGFPIRRKEDFQAMDKDVQNEYLNMASTVGDEHFDHFHDSNKHRMIKSGMNVHSVNDMPVKKIRFMAENAAKYKFSLKRNHEFTPEEREANAMNGDVTLAVMCQMDRPEFLLQQFTPEEWELATRVFETDTLKNEFMASRNPQAIADYFGTYFVQQMQKKIDVYDISFFCAKHTSRDMKHVLQNPFIKWDLLLNGPRAMDDVLCDSNMAYSISMKILDGVGGDAGINELLDSLPKSDLDPLYIQARINLALTSPDPVGLLKKWDLLHKQNEGYLGVNQITRVLSEPALHHALETMVLAGTVSVHSMDTIMMNKMGYTRQNKKEWTQKINDILGQHETPVALNEAYLTRFQKILNS